MHVAYAMQEKYVNDPAILLEAAVEAGLDKEEAAAFIADPEAGKAEARSYPRSVAHLAQSPTLPYMTPGHQIWWVSGESWDSLHKVFLPLAIRVTLFLTGNR